MSEEESSSDEEVRRQESATLSETPAEKDSGTKHDEQEKNRKGRLFGPAKNSKEKTWQEISLA